MTLECPNCHALKGFVGAGNHDTGRKDKYGRPEILPLYKCKVCSRYYIPEEINEYNLQRAKELNLKEKQETI